MRTKKTLIIILACIFAILLAGCESIAQAQQLQPTAVAISLSSSSDTVSNSAADKVTIPGKADISSNTGARVGDSQTNGARGGLAGTWTSDTVQLTIKLLPQVRQDLVGGVASFQGLPAIASTGTDCEMVEEFTYQDQVLTWGNVTHSCPSADFNTADSIKSWMIQAKASYRFTITEENGILSMLFSVEGEDPLSARQAFLDGKTFTRLGTDTLQP